MIGNPISLVVAGLILFQITAVHGFDGCRSGSGDDGVSPQVLLADKSGASSSTRPAEEKKGTAKAPETDKGKSGKATRKPLKPFKPSEKIKVDQIVDFPYDI